VTRGLKRVDFIGGDGIFDVHMLGFLLDQPDIGRVVGIGRNEPKPRVDSLNVRHTATPSSTRTTTWSTT
jgi:hypothetical protein